MKIIYSVAVFGLMLVGLDSFADSLEQSRLAYRQPIVNPIRGQPIRFNPPHPRPAPNFVRAPNQKT